LKELLRKKRNDDDEDGDSGSMEERLKEELKKRLEKSPQELLVSILRISFSANKVFGQTKFMSCNTA
jgi:hypothetical protein